jgi:hypothetical protein
MKNGLFPVDKYNFNSYPMKLFLSVVLLFAVLYACGDESNKNKERSIRATTSVNSVVSNLVTRVFAVDAEVFTLRGTHARLIRTEKGTRIHIPSSAFVMEETGEAVTGIVTLSITEFLTHGEILSSGIPMVYYTPEGDTANFESAGMFEIRAFQDGKVLELADGKEIEVEFATDVEGPFEFYAFDESTNNWVLKEEATEAIVNPYIAKQREELEELEKEMPIKPKKLISYKSGDPLFDIKRYGARDEVLDALNGVFWKFTGDSTQVDPSKNNAAFNKNYEFVKLQLVDSSLFREYELTFSRSGEEVVVRAAPIFQGKLLTRENNRMARILNQLDYAIRTKAELERQLAQEKMMMRLMNIDGMGIYNYDVQMNDPKVIALNAKFTFDGQETTQKMMIYLMPMEKRSVIKYTPDVYGPFALNPYETNRIIAILNDNSVYVMAAADVRKMNLARKKPTDPVVFDLKRYGQPIKKATEVDELIATL